MKRPWSSLSPATTCNLLWCACVVTSPLWMNDYQTMLVGTVAISAMAGVGMNVLLGLSGQISLGHAAFFAIGAYACSLMTLNMSMHFHVAAVLAGLMAGGFGLMLALPALRLRGPYLAMVSIAFGYFIEQGIANWKELTGGWNGISGIPAPTDWNGQAMGPGGITATVGLISAGLLLGYSKFAQSRWGQLMRAVKDSEVAAESLGMRLILIRVLAFSLSAAITGWAGAFFAALQGFISPESFPFFQSIIFLLMVLVGGRGHPMAPWVGAVVVVGLPESIAFLAQYRLLFFGLALMLVLWLAPHGLMGLITRMARLPLVKKFIRSPSVVWDWKSMASGELERFLKSNPSKENTSPPLIVQHLSQYFGGNAALTDVNVSFAMGQVTSLIGPNGAGKSTLINVVGGFYKASQGQAVLAGTDLTQQPIHQMAKLGIARTFQTSQLFAEMSVLDNVKVGMYRGHMFKALDLESGLDPTDVALQLLCWVGFRGDPHAKASQLPHVDRRLVEIARALATRPKFIFLDEPAAGLSKEESHQLGLVLKQIAEHGVGVGLVEHDMGLVMAVSDHIHVLESGKWIASGKPAEILDNPQVKHAYLGSMSLDTKDTAPGLTHDAAAFHFKPLSSPVRRQSDAWLSVQHMSAHHGAATAVENLSIQLSAGRCLAILGANGAGKSTLMRSIAGLHSNKQGEIIWGEQNIVALPAHEIARLGITLIPEGRQVFTELTVEENIHLGSHATEPLSTDELNQLYRLFPALKPLRNRKAGTLSGGEQQMLAFARGLAARPIMLMLDEPSLGLAPVIVQELFDCMLNLKKQGLTLLLVDQMAGLAMSMADEVGLLQSGQMRFKGTPQDMLDSQILEHTYLNQHETFETPSSL